jgi:exopolysaccharide biosynthesis polyprenyl glycosylphosphotransferase
MLRRYRQLRMQIHELLDACLFAAAFAIAYLLRASEHVEAWFHWGGASPFEDYLWLYVIVIPAAPLLLEANGFYDRPLVGPRRKMVWPLFKACALTTIGLILVIFLFRLTLARPVIFAFGVISFLLVWLKEELLRIVYKAELTQAQIRRRFILAGTTEEVARIRDGLKARPEEGVDVVSELRLDETPVDRLVPLLHEHSVNGVIVSAKHTYFEQVEAVLKACEVEGVEAWLVADFFATQISRTSFDELHGRPVLVFRTTPDASWQSILKLVLDFVGAALALVLFSPFFLLFALLIKVTSPGPALFRQQRCGLNGHPFMMYKFRTMVTDAEQRKDELARFNEMSGPVFKMTQDPRVIPIGRFLRKYSIDEWPQLYNVLRGEMSLVGPRPLPIDEVRRFDDLSHRRRLSVRPGLTCLWQISGRNQVADFKEWVRLDLEYIDRWSLWLDLKILARTVPIVFTGTGAK